MKKHTDSVEKEFRFQKMEWLVLRAGWCLMAAFLIFGLLGFFGSGTVSRKTAENNAAVIEYERYLRNLLLSEIKIYSKKPLPDSSVYISSDYLNKVRIDKVVPEPASSELQNDRLKLKFNSNEGDPIVLYVVPTGLGSQDLEIEIRGEKQKLHQYIHF
ncbi:MAG TPA: hypothetical protein VGE26_12185 [Sphingobacteriaceae bacterium]